MVCANDRIAVGVLDALRRAGVDVPGAVSVTGYDDSALAAIGHIDLTSVSQAPREQANRAVEAVVERLDGGRTGAVVLGAATAAGGARDDGRATDRLSRRTRQGQSAGAAVWTAPPIDPDPLELVAPSCRKTFT